MVVHPLESSGKQKRSFRGALPSIAVHAAIILVAVHATAHASPRSAAPEPPPLVRYVPTTRPHPLDRARRAAGSTGDRSSVDWLVPHPRPMTISSIVPDGIPTIDSSANIVIDHSEFGPGVRPSPASGSGDTAQRSGTYSAADVERPVSPVGGAPMPGYPEALRSSGIRGSVTAEFVVDTTGRVEPDSFHAITSDNDLFTAAVRSAVLRTHFHPAEAGGRRVRQLVQESFSFVLQ